jgi:YbbR domain-containing protein
VLAKLITVNTDVVNISGATSDISQNVKLVGLPEGVTVLEPASKQVQVIVQIRQRGVQQPLPSQQVSVINVGDGLTATTSPGSVRVTVIGNEQELESLSPDSLIVQVDASGLGPGTYQLAPTVILPQNMEWTDIEPSSIEVTIVRGTGTPEASPRASPVP